MTKATQWGSWMAVAIALCAAGCADGPVDDPDFAPNSLLVDLVSTENVTAAIQGSGVCTGDNTTPCTNDAQCAIPNVGGSCAGISCVREVPEWSVTFSNVPVNSLAVTEPFNSIVMENVSITYTWYSPMCGMVPCPTGPLVPPGGLFDIAVPPNGSNTVTFFPLIAEQVSLVPLFETRTVSLTMDFRGHNAVNNDAISVVATSQLIVEACF